MKLQAADDVSQDAIGRFCLRQPQRGYRFSIDAVLLADFVSKVKGPLADFCAGCGVVGILMHGLGSPGPFTAVELDPLAARCCRENYQAAGLAATVLAHDLTLPHEALAAGCFAQVVCNPPFGKKGAGRLSPDPARATARHELALTPDRLLEAAARLLMPKGCFAMCWPPSRLAEAFRGLAEHGLTPKRLRLVHGRAGKPASIALLEAVKHGGEELAVEPPLFVYGQGQSYTDETAAIYRELA